jgi:hypothetical protein
MAILRQNLISARIFRERAFGAALEVACTTFGV